MAVAVNVPFRAVALADIYTPDSIESATEEERAALTEYLAHFVIFSDKVDRCRCGRSYSGLLVGSFTWGLFHGEGFCGECHWPVRMYHRDIGPTEIGFAFPLPYHPDEVEERSDD